VSDYLVITCEHGGNAIPARYRNLFESETLRLWLDSHRGFDDGALIMAEELAAAFAAPLVASTTSRLLIDLNRSQGHPQLFSPPTRDAPADVRREILEQYYRPFRTQVETLVTQAVDAGHRAVHISSHSFTPELHGEVRNNDIGLLYDPSRSGERELCLRWKSSLQRVAPEFRVRRNYPYRGKNDGFTTTLRRHFRPEAYVGIELEINQKLVGTNRWPGIRSRIIDALRIARSP
jgi:predicted N-formylglutamate amidohydrolase